MLLRNLRAAPFAIAVIFCMAAVRSVPAQAQAHVQGGSASRLDDTTGLGSVSFANTGAKSAQAPFIRGLALLHSFEYDDAADAFREAQRRDPGFALAYWLEAFTYRHGVWGQEWLGDARKALAKLAPTTDARLAKAGSPRERAFGAAIEAMLGDGTERQRVHAYADSMRRLADATPADPEWSTFASIAVMDEMRLVPFSQQPALRNQAIGYAERVFAAHPNHPGAAHFVIHANDEPALAAHAEAAARAYARIAPSTEHALHMPSHIFVQLGYWDDAVRSNEQSWAASTAAMRRRDEPPATLSWHTLFWLEYGYLQQGRLRAARATLDTVRKYLGDRGDTIPGVDNRFAAAMMHFLDGASTGRWAPASPIVRGSDRNARALGMERGADQWNLVAMIENGDHDGAVRRLAELRAASDSTRLPDRVLAQLEGVSLLHGSATDRARGIEMLRTVARVDTMPPIGPPLRLLTAEVLGAALLRDGNPADAARSFDQALRLTPGRSSVLLGLARARARAGDSAGAAAAYRQLRDNWKNADPDLPWLAEVRAGAQSR